MLCPHQNTWTKKKKDSVTYLEGRITHTKKGEIREKRERRRDLPSASHNSWARRKHGAQGFSQVSHMKAVVCFVLSFALFCFLYVKMTQVEEGQLQDADLSLTKQPLD